MLPRLFIAPLWKMAVSSLRSLAKAHFEDLFGMDSGYVLDFTNRTFQDFMREDVSVDIFSCVYSFAASNQHARADCTDHARRLIAVVREVFEAGDGVAVAARGGALVWLQQKKVWPKARRRSF